MFHRNTSSGIVFTRLTSLNVGTMRIKQLTVQAALADLSLAMLSSIVTFLGTAAFAAMIFSGAFAKVVPLAFLAFLAFRAGTALSGLMIGCSAVFTAI